MFLNNEGLVEINVAGLSRYTEYIGNVDIEANLIH